MRRVTGAVMAGSRTVEVRVRSLRRALREEARPSTFADLQAYLGSPVPVLGVPAAGLGRIVRRFFQEEPTLSAPELRQITDRLWRGSVYDERALAIALLHRHARALDDAAWRMMERWVDTATGWALSDGLASGPVAEVVGRDPRRLRTMAAWARSPDAWRRRASLYAMSRLVRSGRLAPPLAAIHRLRRDPDRWVQRAVGTWLRECWKRDEPRIRRYLLAHAAELSPVSLTVATERASPRFRSRLRTLAKRVRGTGRVDAPVP